MVIHDLGHLIKRLQHRHHRTADASLIEVGTTLAQWDALRAIGRCPGASAHQLAVMTFQSDQSFGQLANRLISADLVVRKAGHGRAFEHVLTEKGHTTLERGSEVTRMMLQKSFSPLDADEKAMLYALLMKVIDV